MGEANLLPCPFCGGSIVVPNWVPWDEYLGGRTWRFVKCESCGARGPARDTREQATEAWNLRPDLGEVVNAAWRKANLLGIELAEERVISEARERANVAARERIAELEERMAGMTERAPELVVKDAETGREIQVLGLNATAPIEESMLVMVPVDRKGPPV